MTTDMRIEDCTSRLIEAAIAIKRVSGANEAEFCSALTRALLYRLAAAAQGDEHDALELVIDYMRAQLPTAVKRVRRTRLAIIAQRA